MQPVRPTGSPNARVMVVGEAPGADEERKGIAFCGSSGWELDKMLKEVGLNRDSCFVTNVVRYRPEDNDIAHFIPTTKKAITAAHVQLRDKWVLPVVKEGYELLMQEIALVQPQIIIALGGTALWALTGHEGIAKWRGSMLYSQAGIKVLPTYHPAALFRQWPLRPVVVQDLRRAAHFVDRPWPQARWEFQIRPSFLAALDCLQYLYHLCTLSPTKLSVDIETRAFNIACLGIAWTKHQAICIPFMELGKPEGYWTEAEEAEIVYCLYQLLTHPNARVIGQNFIYDAQYIYKAWHFIPRFFRDTLLTHHTLFPGMQKSLDFICSFHNEQYVFWKDEGKQLSLDRDEDRHWRYNCEDCVRTFEADSELAEVTEKMGMVEVNAFQNRIFFPVLSMMNRGCLIDYAAQKGLHKQLTQLAAELLEWIEFVVGWPLNPRSHVQMKNLFYEELKQPKIMVMTSVGQRLSCNSAALGKIAVREPMLKPLVEKIEEWRSVQVYLSHFLEDARDDDGRLRCSYNIAGTKTFRFSSSENVWGGGYNLQTVPKGEEE